MTLQAAQVPEKPPGAKGTADPLQDDRSRVACPGTGSVKCGPQGSERVESAPKQARAEGSGSGLGRSGRAAGERRRGDTARSAVATRLIAPSSTQRRIRARSRAGGLTTTLPDHARRWLLRVVRMGSAPRASGVPQQPPGPEESGPGSQRSGEAGGRAHAGSRTGARQSAGARGAGCLAAAPPLPIRFAPAPSTPAAKPMEA